MATSTATYTPSPLVKYIGLTVLLIAAVVLTYVSKIFPDTVGLTAIVAYVPSVIYYVSHDLESAGTPNGIPSYTTFAVIVVATGLEGAIGQFVLQNGTVTLAAGLVFAIALLNLIFHTIAEDQGANAPAQAENWATGAIGVAIGLLAFYYGNPSAGITAWIATVVTVVGQYFHVTTDGSSISVTPVNPSPTPAPTPS